MGPSAPSCISVSKEVAAMDHKKIRAVGAAFLVEYLSGKDIPYCLEVATERAAYVVSHMDAVPE